VNCHHCSNCDQNNVGRYKNGLCQSIHFFCFFFLLGIDKSHAYNCGYDTDRDRAKGSDLDQVRKAKGRLVREVCIDGVFVTDRCKDCGHDQSNAGINIQKIDQADNDIRYEEA